MLDPSSPRPALRQLLYAFPWPCILAASLALSFTRCLPACLPACLPHPSVPFRLARPGSPSLRSFLPFYWT
ncbi:hypothetical protein BDZ88DRAFT_296371 [Geranomyces variabilis]|nr:hypothetical protein BDZ88DRAFT_296371 [Geranomyces variabilis]